MALALALALAPAAPAAALGSLPGLTFRQPLVSLSSKLPAETFPAELVAVDKRRGFTGRAPSCSMGVSVRAVVAERLAAQTAQASEGFRKTKYFFLVANAEFMLDREEHFQEVLMERLRNYGERNKVQDFWLVVEPKFLDIFPDLRKRLKRPAVGLVSTDRRWITFMKLRLDRVLRGEFEATMVSEALESDSAHLHLEKPEMPWTAPYPKYESGWWTPFLPSLQE